MGVSIGLNFDPNIRLWLLIRLPLIRNNKGQQILTFFDTVRRMNRVR
jgi:hypothetical protein